jgi:hypothetical protein
LFGERATSPYIHEGLLLAIAVVLVIGCVVGAVLLLRRAPAVSIALACGVVVGTVAFFVSATRGPRGLPQDVGVWASVGLWIGGTIGLVLTRGRRGSGPLWRIALTCLILTPFGATLLLLAVQQACPLYVMRGAGYCFYADDVLGGWAGGVTVLFILDSLAIVGLMLLAGWQTKRREAPSPEDAAVVLL